MTGERDWNFERAIIAGSAAGREGLIAESFLRVTGRPLVPLEKQPATALWELPAAVVAHGTEADPVFFYGNRTALALFEMTAEAFVRLPSRLSAERGGREQRARLMERVTADNFVTGYSGVRVSATGKRFRIEDATVWNLLDAEGALRGQAAMFERWTPLDPRPRSA